MWILWKDIPIYHSREHLHHPKFVLPFTFSFLLGLSPFVAFQVQATAAGLMLIVLYSLHAELSE